MSLGIYTKSSEIAGKSKPQAGGSSCLTTTRKSDLRLLHVIKDEKFIDSAFELFESVAQGSSTYLIESDTDEFQHLTKVHPIRVGSDFKFDLRFKEWLNQHDGIILHSLFPFALKVLQSTRPSTPVVWIGMGYDYYDLLQSNNLSLIKPVTHKMLDSHCPRTRMHLGAIGKSWLKGLLGLNLSRKTALLKKIDLFAPVLKTEHAILARQLGPGFPRYLEWNYNKIGRLFNDISSLGNCSGSNILVGNSATKTNNHIDTLHALARLNIPDDAKIIAPLSYGPTTYRDAVIQEGWRLFGEQFEPIIEFLPLEAYVKLIQSCSTVIMNHIRQQAAGNIYLSLFLGARVYLDRANPLYTELRRLGFVINEMQELSEDTIDFKTGVPPELAEKNRALAKSLRSLSRSRKQTARLINEIERLRKQRTLDA